jgi:hypothetical protein
LFDQLPLSQVEGLLTKGDVDLCGQLVNGSNYTFLARVSLAGQELIAVYKPIRGEQPLYDFSAGTLARREAAAYQLSRALGWDFIPPTVFRRKLPMGSGSLQAFIRHNPSYHYFNFSAEDRLRLKPVVLFDLIANNADRKGGHVLIDRRNHLWLIDHGLCFHVEDKLRTVIWDFAGEEIPSELLARLRAVYEQLTENGWLARALDPLLRPAEIAALAARTRRLLENGYFPLQPTSRRSYPWPLVR